MNEKIAYLGNWGFRHPEIKEREFGITVCSYQAEKGVLNKIGTCLNGCHVGCICIDREKGILYCTDERMGMPEFGGELGGGRIFAMKIEENGHLTELNHQPSFAPMPTYLALNDEKNALILVNHSGFGNAVVSEKDIFDQYHVKVVRSEVSTILYPLAEDGSILPPEDIFKHSTRKTACGELQPALHFLIKIPERNRYLVCDIGTDRIYTFQIENNQLKVCHCYEDEIGSGPRMGCVHSEKPFYFCNYERIDQVSSFRYSDSGELVRICSIPVLPEICGGEAGEASDLKLHPNGRYLYNITRIKNVISVIKVDSDSGQLALEQTVSFEATKDGCRGARGCCISEDGKYLFVCVADDEVVIRYQLDKNGLIVKEDGRIHMGNPANMVFL